MLGVLSVPLSALAMAAVCLPFAVSAVTKWRDQAGALDEMAAGGFPRSVPLLLGIVICQLVGIVLILSRLAPAAGAVLLAVFLLGATLAYHQFWRASGALRLSKLNHFCENLALVGALALIAINP